MHSVQILGTSHISRQSISAIKTKIQEWHPDIVAVELDRYRLPHLFEPKKRSRIRDLPKLGLVGFLFNFVGGWLQRKLGEKVGLAPGADMRTAIRAAQQENIPIALIDRPITITLQRLSTELTAWEKIKFVSYLIGGFVLPAPKELGFDIRTIPEERIVTKLTFELRRTFPQFYRILVKERDAYMAEQIRNLVRVHPHKKILVVVGAGHVRGLSMALRNLF